MYVFKAMEFIAQYFGDKTSTEYTIVQAWADAQGVVYYTALLNVLAHAIDSGQIESVVSLYFNYNLVPAWADVSTEINNGDPVMAIVNNNHEVMITGYNNDGSVQYYDPYDGIYHTTSTPVTSLSSTIVITSHNDKNEKSI